MRNPRVLHTIFFILFVLSTSRLVYAEPTKTEQAEVLFQEGYSLFQRDEYEEALAKFRASFVIERSPRVWANIIFCLEPLGRDVEAIAEYDALVEAYGESVSAESREQLEPYLLELGRKLGFGLLSMTTPGVGVSFLDGKPLGVVPRKMPIRVLSGEHVLRVEIPQTVPLEQVVLVSAGKFARLSLSPRKRVPMEVSASLLLGNSLGTNLESFSDSYQWRPRGFGVDVRHPLMFGQTWGIDFGVGYLQAHGETGPIQYKDVGYVFTSERLGLFGGVLQVGGRAQVVVSPASQLVFRMGIGSFFGAYQEEGEGGSWWPQDADASAMKTAATMKEGTKFMAALLMLAEAGFSRQLGPISLGASLGMMYTPLGGTFMSAPKGAKSNRDESSLRLSPKDGERGRRVESLFLVFPSLWAGLRL